MYPTDRRYSKEHEWVLAGNGEVTVGITDFAQDQLGDIVYVELPESGKRFGAGDVLGTIESVKAVSEIYAPVGGTIVAVNSELDTRPELVNSHPHTEGWYCKIEPADRGELEALMDSAAYEELVRGS